MKQLDHTIVWLDCETGGLDPNEHQITQLAAIVTDGPDLEETEYWFEAKVELIEGRWTEEALAEQNYNELIWKVTAQPALQVMKNFKDWLEPFGVPRESRKGKPYRAAHMAGHNADHFDRRFIRKTADRCDVWLPLATWTGGIYDTLHLAKAVELACGVEFKRYRLEEISEELGLPKFNAHDALDDVRATIRLARALLSRLHYQSAHEAAMKGDPDGTTTDATPS